VVLHHERTVCHGASDRPNPPISAIICANGERRHLSQLDLAGDAAIPHALELRETGRAAPSRDMVLKLASSSMCRYASASAAVAAGFAPRSRSVARRPRVEIGAGSIDLV